MIPPITLTGVKGAIPKLLRERLLEELGEAGPIDPTHQELLELSRSMINRAVSRAPKGAEISAQILLSEDPFGGWSIGVVVDASPPLPRPGA